MATALSLSAIYAPATIISMHGFLVSSEITVMILLLQLLQVLIFHNLLHSVNIFNSVVFIVQHTD